MRFQTILPAPGRRHLARRLATAGLALGMLLILDVGVATDAAAGYARAPQATAAGMPAFLQFVLTRQLYVSPSGSDGNAGTSLAAPLRTIRAALGRARSLGPGTEILVRAGTYWEGTLLADMNGTASAWYALRGYPGERPVIAGNRDWQLVHLRGSYFLFEGFEISGSRVGRTMSDGTYIGSRADLNAWGLRQTDCLSTGENCGTGVYVQGSSSATVHHVILRDLVSHDFPGAGIQTNLADLLLIEQNRAFGNANLSFYGHSGISVASAKPAATGQNPSYRIIVRRNLAYGNYQMVPTSKLGLTTATDGNGIILDSFGDYPYRSLIENNLAVNNGGAGIHAFRTKNVDMVNNTAYYNSASMDHKNGQMTALVCDYVRFYNNILVGKSGEKINSTYRSTNVTSTSNIFYGNATPDSRSSTDRIVDPKFVRPGLDVPTADFGLAVGSPAVNLSSAQLSAVNDLYGRPRIGVRDIGAVESW